MQDDHIVDGDYVLIEKMPSARDGDIVVALVGGSETTLKRIYREGSQIRLQPANASMQPIRGAGCAGAGARARDRSSAEVLTATCGEARLASPRSNESKGYCTELRSDDCIYLRDTSRSLTDIWLWLRLQVGLGFLRKPGL